MLSKEGMESLSDLVQDTEHHVRNINIHDSQGQMTAALLHDLATHVKQLQLEVLALEQRCERRREEVYAELRNIVPGAGR